MTMNTGSREAILAAARRSAQTHGYNGLNFRDLATEVGIKAASIYYYFPSKADLGAAVARRYWEDTSAELEAIRTDTPDPLMCLLRYPEIFRRSLENGNRLCLGSFMSAEQHDLPETVKHEVQTFADINVAWLDTVISAINGVFPNSTGRARAIFAAVSGAQLLARSRSDITVFDEVIENYREVGLLK
ncbi:TetR/AcrR family transcriptional regulator [Gluconobacter sp. Dm-62]|uniref:TetR/AcrR family transcriptional regulator n=1 Tax=Gluconobacter sp. Dm-62 TaxID=2799804 RepID=UPI002013B57F|nr:TetR/AcrR family transcriptional regulator [Gluconobacter sp. Dm-62]